MATDTISPAPKTTTITAPDAGWTPVAFPPGAFDKWLRRRQEWGADKRDEVWNGVYVVMPPANLVHQDLSLKLSMAFLTALGGIGGVSVHPSVGVTDSVDDWETNFRVPDISVFLPGNPAKPLETHWLGGPDFAVEIVSKGDRSRDKLGFYAGVGVRELLFVERRPWALELYRRDGQAWKLAGKSDVESSQVIESSVLPVRFRLIPGETRPRIEVSGRDGSGPWLA